MPIPNRLDHLARPFVRRWQRAWDGLASAADTPLDREDLLAHHPRLVRELEAMAYRQLRWHRSARHLLALARRPERLAPGMAAWFDQAPTPPPIMEQPPGGRLRLRFDRVITPASHPCDGSSADTVAAPRILLTGWNLEPGKSPAAGTNPQALWLADHPAWLALLRLRPLREFWVLQLRAKHLASLAAVRPPAWILDHSPLPPAAVWPGLEDWRALRAGSTNGADSWHRCQLWSDASPGPGAAAVALPPLVSSDSHGWQAEFSWRPSAKPMALLESLQSAAGSDNRMACALLPPASSH